MADAADTLSFAAYSYAVQSNITSGSNIRHDKFNATLEYNRWILKTRPKYPELSVTLSRPSLEQSTNQLPAIGAVDEDNSPHVVLHGTWQPYMEKHVVICQHKGSDARTGHGIYINQLRGRESWRIWQSAFEELSSHGRNFAKNLVTA